MRLLNKKQAAPILVFAIFFTWMLWQYSRVFLYYDDFGYLSLSYGYSVPDLAGHSYHFDQLVEFMVQHYTMANGRLLYTGLYLLLFMLGGLPLVQCSMAFIVSVILYLLYSFIEKGDLSWIGKTALAVFLCLMFGTISLSVNRQGTYWFAASFAYLTPCIPFLFLSRSYFRTAKTGMSIGRTLSLCLLSFISGFSQEQWWIATCVLTLSILLYKWFLGRKSIGDFFIVLSGVVGGSIIALSPAVAMRLTRDNANLAFASLNLPEKILWNVKSILRIFTTGENQPYLTVFLVLMGMMAFWMTVKRLGRIRLHLLYLACTGIFLIEPYILQTHRFVLWIPFLAFTWIEVCQFYAGLKKWDHFFVFLAAVASLGCMVIVPEIPSRCLLPFLLLSFLLASDVACCWLKEHNTALIVLSLLLLARSSVSNLETTCRGYGMNYPVLLENQEKLEHGSQNLKDGIPVEEIVLKKQYLYDYGGDMMYKEPFGFMVYWVREYYDLPHDVVIRYKEDEITQ